MPGVGVIYLLQPNVVEFAKSVMFHELLAGTRFTPVHCMLAIALAAKRGWGIVDSPWSYLYEFHIDVVREVPPRMNQGQWITESTLCVRAGVKVVTMKKVACKLEERHQKMTQKVVWAVFRTIRRDVAEKEDVNVQGEGDAPTIPMATARQVEEISIVVLVDDDKNGENEEILEPHVDDEERLFQAANDIGVFGILIQIQDSGAGAQAPSLMELTLDSKGQPPERADKAGRTILIMHSQMITGTNFVVYRKSFEMKMSLVTRHVPQNVCAC